MLILDNFPDSLLTKTPDQNIAQQLKDYMDTWQGLASRLDDFEKQFSYSKYHLERLFRKQYGTSIVAYRNQKRMELAKRLLQTESVSFVAEKVGFSSIYVFSRAFKQHFGVSPAKIKHENKV